MRTEAMTMDDYDGVMALWRGVEGVHLTATDSRRNMAKYLARNPRMSFVARERGEIVGAILCGHDGRRGYLNHLAVAASHRRRGIGTALVRHCLAALKREGIPRCNLFIWKRNVVARRFWESLGWHAPTDWGVMHRENVDPLPRKTQRKAGQGRRAR